MKYLTSIGLLFLFQLAVTFAVIFATSGGGSFVGLGAMLFAVPGIPGTALVNFALIKINKDRSAKAHFVRSLLIALVLPLAQVGLLGAVKYFRL